MLLGQLASSYFSTLPVYKVDAPGNNLHCCDESLDSLQLQI